MPFRLELSLRQLRAFDEVYKLSNLTYAAESLHMTQSAVSALIRQMEESFDVQLFERSSRMLRPTPAGAAAIERVRSILGSVDALQSQLHSFSRSDDEAFSFTCVPSLASAVVPVLARLKEVAPRIHATLYDEGDIAVIDRVESGECEFGIGSFAHNREKVAQIALLQDHVFVICSKTSHLARLPRVTWHDLESEPIIHLSRGVSLKHLLLDHLPGWKPTSKPAYEVGFIQTALAMAAQGLGVLILPGFYVRGTLQASGIQALRLHDPVVEHAFMIHTRQGHVLSAPARTFLDLLVEELTPKA